MTADVVDGNAANADFQGQPLGNLRGAADTRTAQATALTDLIGKWFEGSDLPAIPSWASYSVTAGPLFGTAAYPGSADMRQGRAGRLLPCRRIGGHRGQGSIGHREHVH